MSEKDAVGVDEKIKEELLSTLKNHINASTNGTAEAASHAQKTLILINGGAILATLAFMPAILPLVEKYETPIGEAMKLLSYPIFFFVGGLVAAILAIISSYTSYLISMIVTVDQHFRILTSKPKEQDGWLVRNLGPSAIYFFAFFTAASIMCFIFGVIEVRNSIISTFSPEVPTSIVATPLPLHDQLQLGP
ncbi:MAG: hypothetical protein EpisKO_04190 [Epibacterium sp.]